MKYHRIAAGCLLFAVSFSSLADALLDEAGGYLQSGEPGRAWELLSPLNDQRAGDLEFDYLLGLAALDIGRYTEAIFALERVLAVDPDYSQARAELARAYFALNELENAKQEFDRVLQDDDVPDGARDNIGSFLSAIEEAQSDKQSSFEKTISLSLGSDDNVNTGPAEASVAVPAFGGSIFTLDDGSLAQESFFALTRLRGSFKNKFDDDFEFLAGATLASRNNSDSDAADFNHQSLDLDFGLRYKWSENNHLTVSLQSQDFDLDGEDYRDTTGWLLQWRNRFNRDQEMSLYTQISDIQYPDQQARDADRQVLGGGYSQFFAGKYNPLIFAGLYAGIEEQQEGNAPQLDYDFSGVRFGGQAKFTRSITAYASASLEMRSYGEQDPFFLKTRKDDYSSYTIGARYEYNRELSFSPEVVSSQNASNIDFYDTEKLAYSVTARYEF